MKKFKKLTITTLALVVMALTICFGTHGTSASAKATCCGNMSLSTHYKPGSGGSYYSPCHNANHSSNCNVYHSTYLMITECQNCGAVHSEKQVEEWSQHMVGGYN